MSLREIVESYAREDADLSELDEQLGAYVNLSELTKDNFIKTLKKVPNAISAYDSVNRSSVETGVENFKNGKMQEEWKAREEKLRQELNPEESEAAKVAREFNEFKANVENEKKLALLKDRLSDKAKELEFPDPMLIRDFAGLGDNAEEVAGKFIELFKTTLNESLSKEIKGKFNKEAPKSSVNTPADLDTKIKEARAAGNTDLALKLQMIKDAQKTA
jgi:hypothetical protein